MMTTTPLSVAELTRRRRQILADIGMTEDELCECAQTGLCSDQWAALAELDEIDCLIAAQAREERLAG
ncbi:hypothetical protein [Georgenia faecalis]|uniref:hypothetical protein n=1 Tax=Georgenia faecalis TaxID=2483799 RepID=UPI000FDCA98B|nr:hypothetical protein [Georgenia faecalis]